MNLKKIIPGLTALCGGIILSGAISLPAADDNAAADEKIITEVPVHVGKITVATLHGYVEGFGTVQPAPATADLPAAGAQLAAPSAGVVTKVNVVEGQQVNQGDVLMELNSQAAEAEAERQKKLYAQQNTSLKNLQEAEAQLAMLRVVAPLSGTIVRVNVAPGQAVDLTTTVAEIMDLKRLSVTVEIPAPVQAKLSFVSPAVDAKSGTVLVRALLPEDSGLRPGLFVSLRIVTAVHTNCLAAPAESVVTDADGQTVVAIVTGGSAKQQPVKTGLRENGLVEIEGQNLKEGETIVTVGAYGLPKETKIKVSGP
jgi:membrane fusion protein, multidrug efflux system